MTLAALAQLLAQPGSELGNNAGGINLPNPPQLDPGWSLSDTSEDGPVFRLVAYAVQQLADEGARYSNCSQTAAGVRQPYCNVLIGASLACGEDLRHASSSSVLPTSHRVVASTDRGRLFLALTERPAVKELRVDQAWTDVDDDGQFETQIARDVPLDWRGWILSLIHISEPTRPY